MIIGTAIENGIRRIGRERYGVGVLMRGAVIVTMIRRIGGKGKIGERKGVLEIYIEYNTIVVSRIVIMRRVWRDGENGKSIKYRIIRIRLRM